MKELSEEEKAHRYDEALVRANEMIKAMTNIGGVAKVDDIQHIFPELKESEDERIRKALKEYFINSFQNNGVAAICGVHIKDILAWLEGKNNIGISEATKQELEDNLNKALEKETPESWNEFLEKQDEQKPYGQRKECTDCQFNYAGECKGFCAMKRGEQKPVDSFIEEEKPLLEKFKQAVYDCAWGKVTCKKEGETKEEYANRWAEHFLLMVRDWADDYIDFTIQQKLRNSYEKGKADIIEQKPAWSEEDERLKNDCISSLEEFKVTRVTVNCIKWLKSLKDRVQPQPKQEWSEEDEREWNNIWDVLDGRFELSKEGYKSAANWFKSIKDRYTWKPSDEQMTALKHYVDTTMDGEIDLLYQDLKKLREE